MLPVNRTKWLKQAAEVICHDIRNQITGRLPSDRDFRRSTKLGEVVADGGFKSIAGLEPDSIMMGYSQ